MILSYPDIDGCFRWAWVSQSGELVSVSGTGKYCSLPQWYRCCCLAFSVISVIPPDGHDLSLLHLPLMDKGALLPPHVTSIWYDTFDYCTTLYFTLLQMSLAEYKKRQQKLATKISSQPERRASSSAVAKTAMPVSSSNPVNSPPPAHVKRSTKSGFSYLLCDDFWIPLSTWR